jgi:biotin carboxyl carrier protein
MSAVRSKQFSWSEAEWLVVLALVGLVVIALFASTTSGISAPAPKPPEATFIVSPWNGTFCASEFPGGRPYVEVGSHVEPATMVARIGAVYAESTPYFPVLSGVNGTIVEVLVTDGAIVEIGQPLFLVMPDPQPATTGP